MAGVRVKKYFMLVTIATFTNPIEAHIVRGRLECEEILAFVSHEHHIWAKWSLSQALGGVKIQVAPPLAEQASQIISDINAGVFTLVSEVDESESEDVHCPNCNATSIIWRAWSWKFSLLVLFFLHIPIPYSTCLLKCKKCGSRWTDRDIRPYPLVSMGIVFIVVSAVFWAIVISAYSFCKLHNLNNLCI
jgi:hypothetical protein